MSWLLKKIYFNLAKHCQTKRAYYVNGAWHQITLDLAGIERQLQKIAKNYKPLIGGLDGGLSPFSLGGSFEECNLIIIKADQLNRKWRFSWQRRWPLKWFVAYLMAHELRHIMQGVHDYGWKTWFLLPWFLGRILSHRNNYLRVIIVSVQLFLFLPMFLYFVLSRLLYLLDWREKDAIWYARAHWQEWIEFVQVTEAGGTANEPIRSGQ